MNAPSESGTTAARPRSLRKILTGLAALTVIPAALSFTGGVAGASTINGVATIASPGTTTALSSGGSNTLFTVALPANSACSGDTASGGYHIYSYLVPQGTSPTAVTFSTGQPSQGLGLFTQSGSYYGPANTDITTGKIFGIPNNFQWAQLITTAGQTVSQLTANVWEAGIACADTHGAVSDYWNTEVTFTASTTDTNGFTWTASPPAITPEVPYAVVLPVLAIGIIGGTIWFRRRRSLAQAGTAV